MIDINELSKKDVDEMIAHAVNIIVGQSSFPNAGMFTPYGIATNVEENFPIEGANLYSNSSHGGYGIKFDIANKYLSKAALRCADRLYGRYWFEQNVQWMILYYEHPSWFLSRLHSWKVVPTKQECELKIREYFPEYFQ